MILMTGALLCTAVVGLAQNSPRAMADREAAEERYRMTQAALNDLYEAQRILIDRVDALEDLVREVGSKPGQETFVSRQEFSKLVELVEEIDRRREADKKQILAKLEALGRTLGAGSSPVAVSSPSSAGQTHEGAEHVVVAGQTLSAIIAAYNAEWKSRGRKTSLDLILEANAGLEPRTMQVGKKIFIPMVPIKP